MKYLLILLFLPSIAFAKTYTCTAQEVYLNDFKEVIGTGLVEPATVDLQNVKDGKAVVKIDDFTFVQYKDCK